MARDLISQVDDARRVSAPLLAIETDDYAACIVRLSDVCNRYHAGPEAPQLRCDPARGAAAVNAAGEAAMSAAGLDAGGSLVDVLERAAGLPSGTVCYLMGLDREMDNPAVLYGVSTLRDAYKSNRRTLVMLAPSWLLPAEWRFDVLLLREERPSRDALGGIVRSMATAAGVELGEADRASAIDAVAGLPAFAAETAVAMALRRSGIDRETAWARKRSTINSAPGLSVYEGTETLESIVGCAAVKEAIGDLLHGRTPPSAILYLDEIEKAIAGMQGDTSGASQGVAEAFLAWAQDSGSYGMLLVGVPGAGKSLTAKGAAGSSGKPLLQLTLSGVKGIHVGETEGNIRSALATVSAVADGPVLMLATCNNMGALTPELRARFGMGTYFYDYPSLGAREAMWRLYRGRYEIPEGEGDPSSERWVGREIESACQMAWRANCSLERAARRIVPISTSAAAQIEHLRASAAGTYLSADYEGVFRLQASAAPALPSNERRTLSLPQE